MTTTFLGRGAAGRTARRRLAVTAAALALLVPACASDADDDPVTAAPPATGGTAEPGSPTATPSGEEVAAEGLVLRVDQTGGFVTPTMLASRLPFVAVYADGRVITQGPQIAIWPPPALPNLQVQRIDPGQLDRLVQLARDAGVGAEPDTGQPAVADAPATRFTVATDEGTQTLEVYALLESGPEGMGLTPEQEAARERLRELHAALTDLPATLGADAVSDAEPYAPEAVAAVTTPYTPMDDGLPPQPEIAWPGPELPGEPLGTLPDLGCVTAEGEQAAQVLDAAEAATMTTPWVSGGSTWTVALRPLLPHESGCADLAAAT